MKSRLFNYSLLALIITFASCSKSQEPDTTYLASSKKTAAVAAAQPLPGDKANWTLVLSRFPTSGLTWVRMVQFTFNAAAGTVGVTYWEWRSDQNKGKTAYNTHTCTFDGKTSVCTVYTPTGWKYPTGQYISATATYTYNTTSKVLVINWPGGQTESWNISNPEPGVARALFASSSYSVTHGHGYGSNAAWSTHKDIAEIAKISYPGYQIRSNNSGGSTNTITPASSLWEGSALNFSGYTYPSNPTPKNAMHWWQPSTVCGSGQNPRTGIINHLASFNDGRAMVFNHFCASLPAESAFPCYSGNNHPYAFMQIIDDAGNMRGFLGLEQQDPGGASYPGHQYALKDYTTIPW